MAITARYALTCDGCGVAYPALTHETGDQLQLRRGAEGAGWQIPPDRVHASTVDHPFLCPACIEASGRPRIDMRFPTKRPGWLGEWQTYPCGRCGHEVDDAETHDCQPAQEGA